MDFFSNLNNQEFDAATIFTMSKNLTVYLELKLTSLSQIQFKKKIIIVYELEQHNQ